MELDDCSPVLFDKGVAFLPAYLSAEDASGIPNRRFAGLSSFVLMSFYIYLQLNNENVW